MNDEIACPVCGQTVKQVASATLGLALWQHWNWACPNRIPQELVLQIKEHFAHETNINRIVCIDSKLARDLCVFIYGHQK